MNGKSTSPLTLTVGLLAVAVLAGGIVVAATGAAKDDKHTDKQGAASAAPKEPSVHHTVALPDTLDGHAVKTSATQALQSKLASQTNLGLSYQGKVYGDDTFSITVVAASSTLPFSKVVGLLPGTVESSQKTGTPLGPVVTSTGSDGTAYAAGFYTTPNAKPDYYCEALAWADNGTVGEIILIGDATHRDADLSSPAMAVRLHTLVEKAA